MSRSRRSRVRALEQARGPAREQVDFAETLDLSPGENMDMYRRLIRGEVEVVGGPEGIPQPDYSSRTREEGIRAYGAWLEESRRTWPKRLEAYKRSIGRSSA